MSIILEDSQRQAVEKIEAWYKSSAASKPFVLAGLAGTGKTTIVKYFMDKLRIPTGEVAFVAFTGKAALVLTHMGTPATTIHKLIYKMKDDTDGNLVFELAEELPRVLRLIVVDEASMVSMDIQKDLESFNCPIIYIGDHGQLPPVSGVSNLMKDPDIKLEKIHRQAEGNPIIFLAKLARLGARIPYKQYSEHVTKISMKEVTSTMMTNVEQILCGKNATRTKLNNRVRGIMGKADPHVTVGDKVIMLRNNWGKGYINGMTGFVKALGVFDRSEVKQEDWWNYPKGQLAMTFESELDRTIFKNVPYDKGIFTGETPPNLKNRCIECIDYAYAITVHKAQGSQYRTAMVIEEWLGDASTHNKWLYTGITRAAFGLVLVGK